MAHTTRATDILGNGILAVLLIIDCTSSTLHVYCPLLVELKSPFPSLILGFVVCWESIKSHAIAVAMLFL